MTTGGDDALVVRGLSKSFAGVPALAPLDLAVPAGQVHALVGQNGCGKSTFVKCLTGYHRPDGGEITVFGRQLSLPVHSPGEHGIAVIHQDVGLVGTMTVLENLGANAKYGTRLLSPVNVRRERATYRAGFERLGVHIPLDAMVADLSPAEHALIGIVRAMRLMSHDLEHHLFILDEPTAYLSRTEAARVTDFMRRVAALGSTVLFISHRLGEVLEYCDAVTVLRDGKHVISAPTAGLSRGDLVAHMLGRRLQDFYPDPSAVRDDAEVRMAARDVSGEVVQDLSLDVRAGEIVGVTGLAGMGQEELPQLLSGAKAPRSGSVTVTGAGDVTGDVRGAIRAGVALVPGNRHRDGCWLDATAAENVTLPSLDRFRSKGRVQWRKERGAAVGLLERSGVRPMKPDQAMRQFSGGNQQKIVFSKWLFGEPDVLLVDEPTQGVDAGASKELLEQVTDLAAKGTAVVVFSGDHEQIAAICHRVLVLNHGRVVAELSGEGLSEAALLEACESVEPVETE
ncbi:sugar ABC transporter ATP-binding protein [Nocardioides sp. GXZ039]|uniref:sugar ABC transporter ATP-binding protein n=1 Tax=Nocardioides sp. GXZ039 TaxID=3136018 RepID=UPI0030F3CFAF